jgi:uncharacterized membrane protein YqaE (UPF0057 family)
MYYGLGVGCGEEFVVFILLTILGVISLMYVYYGLGIFYNESLLRR